VTGETVPGPSPLDELSVVVPSFNEEKRLGVSLERISRYCHERIDKFELIVVDDGSTDDTSEIAVAVMGNDPCFQLVRTPVNRGKGHAVRLGALGATYDFVLFSDADLSTPIEELERLAEHASLDNIVIASRGLPDSNLVERQPFYRETMGKVFNILVRSLLVPGIFDTQCGFKLFGRNVIDSVFRLLKTDRFAFDVEILARASMAGVDVIEVPVKWKNDVCSQVHPLTDSLSMLNDIFNIRKMLKKESQE